MIMIPCRINVDFCSERKHINSIEEFIFTFKKRKSTQWKRGTKNEHLSCARNNTMVKILVRSVG